MKNNKHYKTNNNKNLNQLKRLNKEIEEISLLKDKMVVEEKFDLPIYCEKLFDIYNNIEPKN
jgi:hypothetical protein